MSENQGVSIARVPGGSTGRVWATIFLVLGVLAGVAAGQPPVGSGVQAVARVGFTVADLDTSVRFFEEVLTFEVIARQEKDADPFLADCGLEDARLRVARLRLGDELLELTQFVSPVGRPVPADSRSNDRWFQHIAIIVSDMDRAHARIHEHMVRHASKDPQRLPDWNRNAAGIKAFYFRDPDGHFLEILQFPPDKGDPKWHARSDRLFLGIDHTAIVVADTDRSLAFYRDQLGLRVAGTSENYGPEQEALNNVPGAHLRITTLRAPKGPGIELLEYLRPRDGRPYPRDARPNDQLHWQTTLIVSDPNERVKALGRNKEAVRAPVKEARFLIRDPDGHAMVVSGN